MSDLSVWQKSPDLIVNLKISADFMFSFWAIDPKRKHGICGIYGKEQFYRRECDHSKFLFKKIDCEVI